MPCAVVTGLGMHAQSCLTLCNPRVRVRVRVSPNLSMEVFRQEYWHGLPFPTLGHLIDPKSSESPALAGEFFTTEPPGKSIGYMPHTIVMRFR